MGYITCAANEPWPTPLRICRTLQRATAAPNLLRRGSEHRAEHQPWARGARAHPDQAWSRFCGTETPKARAISTRDRRALPSAFSQRFGDRSGQLLGPHRNLETKRWLLLEDGFGGLSIRMHDTIQGEVFRRHRLVGAVLGDLIDEVLIDLGVWMRG